MNQEFSAHPASESTDGIVDRYRRKGKNFEIVTVVMVAVTFALAAALFRYQTFWIIPAVGGFLLAFLPLHYAITYAAMADSEERQRRARVRYILSERRLKTLKIIDAPEDAMAALHETLRSKDGHKEFSEEELVTRLVHELGRARTDDVKGLVCKYLRVEDQDELTPDKAQHLTPAETEQEVAPEPALPVRSLEPRVANA